MNLWDILMTLTFEENTLKLVLETFKPPVDYSLRWGFTIHPGKSVLHPVQTLVFLGFVLDFTMMTVCLTPEKARRIGTACTELLHTALPTICTVAHVVGSLVAAFREVQYGPLFYR